MALRNLEDQFSRFHIENESGSDAESHVDKFHGGESNSEADKSGDSSDGTLLSSIACPVEEGSNSEIDNLENSSDGPLSSCEYNPVDKFHEEDSKSESDNSENSTGGPLSSYNDLLESQHRDIGYQLVHYRLGRQYRELSHQLFQEQDAFEKNPNCNKCIDVSSLKVEDLPPVYRHTEMLDLIKAIADNLIKITFSDDSGRLMMASALVDYVMISSDDHCVRPCTCDSCSAKEWGQFFVIAPIKLPWGSVEKSPNFVCSFFYDNEDQDIVQQLHGRKLITYFEKNDLLFFSCVTSDMSLLKKLKEGLDTYSDSRNKLFLKYYQLVKWEQEKITFAVSHAYGLRKHLSIAHTYKIYDEVQGNTVGYELAICPGGHATFVLNINFNVKD